MPTKTAKVKPPTSTTKPTKRVTQRATTSATTRAAAGRAKPASQKRVVKTPAPTPLKATRASTRSQVKAPASAAKKPAASAKKPAAPKVNKQPSVAKKVRPAPTPVLAKNSKKAKSAKPKKTKLVRESFNMPEAEYALFAALKKRCLNAGLAAKKSEVLRAAITNLVKLSDVALVAAMRHLTEIKTKRTAKARK